MTCMVDFVLVFLVSFPSSVSSDSTIKNGTQTLERVRFLQAMLVNKGGSSQSQNTDIAFCCEGFCLGDFISEIRQINYLKAGLSWAQQPLFYLNEQLLQLQEIYVCSHVSNCTSGSMASPCLM